MKQTIDKQQMIKLLMAAETEHSDPEVMADMRDLRNGLVDATGTYTTSRYTLGAAMYRYHEVIEHGKWGEVLRILAWATGAFERTLREILKDYTRVADKPEPVIKAMQTRGVDPAAKKNAKIIEMASAEYRAGADPDQAVQIALDEHRQAKTAKRKPLVMPNPQMDVQTAVEVLSRAIAKAIQKIPAEHQQEAVVRATSSALYRVGYRDPITITPRLFAATAGIEFVVVEAVTA